MLQSIRHQAAHGFAMLVFQMNVEELIELIQIRLGLHTPAFVIHRGNVVFAQIDVVEFVSNLAHDLFNDIFNRDQTGHGTELINHQRHVVARDAKITEHHIQGLRFRNKTCGTQVSPNIISRIDKQTKQILGV